MGKPYKVKFYHNDNEGYDTYHRIEDETNDPDVNLSFRANDLCECPEDATLFRALFNGWDYIETIELGMKLANLGYDSIEVEHITEN